MNVRFRALVPADMITVNQVMSFAPSPDCRGIVAFDLNTSKTLAIVILHDWTKTSAQIHQIILNPMVIRHGWFEEIAQYVFGTANLLKLYGLVPETNVRALSLNEKIGFQEVARLEDAVDFGVDYILMELSIEDVPEKYWPHKHTGLREVVNG